MSDEQKKRHVIIRSLIGPVRPRNRVIAMLATMLVTGFFLAPVFLQAEHGPWIIGSGAVLTFTGCVLALECLWQ
jgi:hypothetical protein